MQQQERDLISGLFDRLKPFESQPRDNEVEQFIWDRASKQPASAYLLVQTVLVQEQALKAAQDRIAELEAKAAPQPEAGRFSPAHRRSARGGRRAHRCHRHKRRRRRQRRSMVPSTRLALAGRRLTTATAGRWGQLPANGHDDRRGRGRRRAAVRRHSQSDGQQSRAVRRAAAAGARRNPGRDAARIVAARFVGAATSLCRRSSGTGRLRHRLA